MVGPFPTPRNEAKSNDGHIVVLLGAACPQIGLVGEDGWQIGGGGIGMCLKYLRWPGIFPELAVGVCHLLDAIGEGEQ